MATDEQAFLRRLLATFKQEADDHLRTMAESLRALASQSQPARAAELSEILFREAHSPKGAARSVDLVQVEGLCHALETTLARLRNREVAPSTGLFDVLHQVLDRLAHGIEAGVAGKPGTDDSALLQALARAADAVPQQAAPPAAAAQEPAPAVQAEPAERIMEFDAADTVRISAAKLMRMFEQVEELTSFSFAAGRMAEELRALHGMIGDWERQSVLPEPQELRSLAGTGSGNDSGVQDIVRARTFARTLTRRLVRAEIRAESDRHQLATMLGALQDEMKEALMLPFSSLFDVLPRMVRELARERGKEVELVMHGEAVEIDRRVQEQIRAPLIHLIRNAVDHGLEMPAERRRKNKPTAGRITVGVLPKDGNRIELCVADDGSGLDIAKIKRSALELGIRSAEQLDLLGPGEAAELIFESGLSTSAALTDVSGRGLGMAIVREKVEKVGGTIAIESAASGGTCFRIALPATLTALRGLLVRVAGRQLVLPSLNVESVCRLARIAGTEDPRSIDIDGEDLPLGRLQEVLGLENSADEGAGKYIQIVVLSAAGMRFAVSVDEIVGDQEMVVKGLGPQVVRVPNISAVTLLDGGRIVPILNAQDLMKAVLSRERTNGTAYAATKNLHGSLLIVEDSTTTRMQLRNLLETEGYEVTAVADGIDALTALGERRFDLVITDIEMPRMDGYTLVERIRADPALRALPVVLLSTLDSRASRERGLVAGANAYVAKGGFDQRNLLETIRRLR